jgi:hypothetical protein
VAIQIELQRHFGVEATAIIEEVVGVHRLVALHVVIVEQVGVQVAVSQGVANVIAAARGIVVLGTSNLTSCHCFRPPLFLMALN